jgi:hypothetical protein
MAVIQVGRAQDPMAAFQERQETIEAAMIALGRDFNATKFLASCGVAAECLTPAAAVKPTLPNAAEVALKRMLHASFGVDDPDFVLIDEVSGGEHEGFELDFVVSGKKDHAFAIEFDGEWVFAPGPIGREDLAAVTYAARRHFDVFFGMGLCLKGYSDDQLTDLRNSVRPIRALWPNEADPERLCDSYAVVFVLHNPADRERPIFCGYDPMNEQVEPYHENDPE